MHKYMPQTTRPVPKKNFASRRLSPLRQLCATNVTMKVMQFTAGTAMDSSDLATRKLLKILAHWFSRKGTRKPKFANIFKAALT